MESRSFQGFRPVDREEFFATVGQMDVTPYPLGEWDDKAGYLSHWKTRSGRLVGLSDDYSDGKRAGVVTRVGRYWVKA